MGTARFKCLRCCTIRQNNAHWIAAVHRDSHTRFWISISENSRSFSIIWFNPAQISGLISVIPCIQSLSKTDNFFCPFMKIIWKLRTLKKMKPGSLPQKKLLYGPTALTFLILSLLTGYFLLHLTKHFESYHLQTPLFKPWELETQTKASKQFPYTLNQQHYLPPTPPPWF